jgi:Ca2+-binding EF-hand superfamily protein
MFIIILLLLLEGEGLSLHYLIVHIWSLEDRYGDGYIHRASLTHFTATVPQRWYTQEVFNIMNRLNVFVTLFTAQHKSNITQAFIVKSD